MFNGKIHYNWQFSIAMFNYQRVNPNSIHLDSLNSVYQSEENLCEIQHFG